MYEIEEEVIKVVVSNCIKQCLSMINNVYRTYSATSRSRL